MFQKVVVRSVNIGYFEEFFWISLARQRLLIERSILENF